MGGEVLEPLQVQRIIQGFFPGAEVEVTQGIGCFQCQLTIWKFHLLYSLTTQALSHVDRRELLLAVFNFRYDTNSAPVIISRADLQTEDDLRSHLTSVTKYLNGIAAALMLSQSPDSIL